ARASVWWWQGGDRDSDAVGRNPGNGWRGSAARHNPQPIWPPFVTSDRRSALSGPKSYPEPRRSHCARRSNRRAFGGPLSSAQATGPPASVETAGYNPRSPSPLRGEGRGEGREHQIPLSPPRGGGGGGGGGAANPSPPPPLGGGGWGGGREHQIPLSP